MLAGLWLPVQPRLFCSDLPLYYLNVRLDTTWCTGHMVDSSVIYPWLRGNVSGQPPFLITVVMGAYCRALYGTCRHDFVTVLPCIV